MGVKENRKLWLDALRSGEYNQGKFWLNKGDRLCCLGVLCETYQKHGLGDLEIKEYLDNDRPSMTKEVVKTYNNENTGAPDKVCEWAGFKRGSYLKNNEGLITLNDMSNHSFSEIADKIEKYGFIEEVQDE